MFSENVQVLNLAHSEPSCVANDSASCFIVKPACRLFVSYSPNRGLALMTLCSYNAIKSTAKRMVSCIRYSKLSEGKRRQKMGDKGGKKDKEKGQKQKSIKQAQDMKDKKGKQPKSTLK